MSAAVVPFTGKQVGPVFERSAAQRLGDDRVTREARLVRGALGGETGWQTAALMALVKSLDKTQRLGLLGILDARAIAADDYEAEQAAAMIRFETGEPEEIARVATLVARMRGRGQ